MSRRYERHVLISAVALSIWGSAGILLAADGAPQATVVLDSGGVLRAEVHPATAEGGETVILEAPGLLIELPKKSVEETVAPDPLLAEYAARAAKTSDEAAAHFALSEWCRENSLDPERTYELQRTIAFDPDHEAARKALGYTKSDGKWMHPEQTFLDLGYVRHRGDWYTKAELEKVLADEEIEKKRRGYLRDMLNWRHQVDGRQGTEAILNFQRVQDPLAVFAFSEMLKKEKTEAMRQVYVDVLGRIPGGDASALLTTVAMTDPLQSVRDSATSRLVDRQANYVVPGLISHLRGKDVTAINRAAVIVGRMRDNRAVPALIDALVTEQKVTITTGGSGSVTPMFGSGAGGGGGGLSAGSSTRTERNLVRNSEVLGALNAITGENKGFDQDLWRRWYSDARNLRNVNLRGLPR